MGPGQNACHMQADLYPLDAYVDGTFSGVAVNRVLFLFHLQT